MKRWMPFAFALAMVLGCQGGHKTTGGVPAGMVPEEAAEGEARADFEGPGVGLIGGFDELWVV